MRARGVACSLVLSPRCSVSAVEIDLRDRVRVEAPAVDVQLLSGV